MVIARAQSITEQQFGTVEVNDLELDVMLCVDHDDPDTAFVYVWSETVPPKGMLANIDLIDDKKLSLRCRYLFLTDDSGNFIPDQTANSSQETLSQIYILLHRRGRGFRGIWRGPKGSGAIRLRPKTSQGRKVADLCNNWDDFKQWASRSRNVNDIACYRGHGDSNFKVSTSFHRDGKQRIDRFVYGNLATFHDHAQTFLNRGINLKDGSEYATLLALAQHHGLPTPMLDATRSPYIAAFFAFSDFLDNRSHRKPTPKYVRVYGFSRYFLDHHTPPSVSIHFPKPYISRLRVSGIHNPRLSAQQGEFLVTNIADLETTIQEMETATGKTFMVAADIPSSFAAEALEDLSFMGLTAANMFPGLDGICRMLRHQAHFVRRQMENSVATSGKDILPTNDSLWGEPEPK